jgi:hypothetical protein
MGTRHLTMVISNGKPKVAQYGQWDGYPDGQGSKVLAFLQGLNGDYTAFKEKVNNLRFATPEDDAEVQAFLKSIGCEDGWMNMEQSAKFQEKYMFISRDMGAEILNAIMYGKVEKHEFRASEPTVHEMEVRFLQDQTDFAADSLFCEWLWLIDLDKLTFEGYKGFNQKPLGKGQRFRYLQDANKHRDTDKEGNLKPAEYYPVRLAKTFSLENLPSDKEFCRSFMSAKERKQAEKEDAEEEAKKLNEAEEVK